MLQSFPIFFQDEEYCRELKMSKGHCRALQKYFRMYILMKIDLCPKLFLLCQIRDLCATINPSTSQRSPRSKTISNIHTM